MNDHATLGWIKSSLSQNGDCVEWAPDDGGRYVFLRDSKDQAGPVLRFTRREWEAFVSGVKRGEADLGQRGPSAIGDR